MGVYSEEAIEYGQKQAILEAYFGKNSSVEEIIKQIGIVRKKLVFIITESLEQDMLHLSIPFQK